MSECVHESNNPFALSSAIQMCKEETRKGVELLHKCLTEKGSLITQVLVIPFFNYKHL